MRAIVIDPQSPQRLGFRTVEPPVRGPRRRLSASRRSRSTAARWCTASRGRRERPWGGTWRESSRARGEGTRAGRGARVVALLHSGAWAEQAAVPVHALAELEPTVSLCPGSSLADRRAHRVDRARTWPKPHRPAGPGDRRLWRSRAHRLPVGVTGRCARRWPGTTPNRPLSLSQEAGADDVVVDENIAGAEPFGPYHLIVEQLGGQALAEVMTQLVPGGTCVSIGVSTGPAGYQVPVDMAPYAAGTGGLPADLEPLSRA